MDELLAFFICLSVGILIFSMFFPFLLFWEVRKLRKMIKNLEEKLLFEKEKSPPSLSRNSPSEKEGEMKEKSLSSPSSPASLPVSSPSLAGGEKKMEKTLPLPPIPPRELSPFEKRTKEAFSKIWNWLVVGEEYRKEGIKREYAIGATWLLRGGFLLLFFGIGYFIKFSHERNLFPPELRLAAGSVFAFALIYAGCRMLKGKYAKIGSALAGGGFAALYCIVLAAFTLYKLLPGSVALALLVLLTLCGLCLAVAKNIMVLGILAVAGGYLAPLLTSTGSRNLTGVCLYMGILGGGVLATTFFRSWRSLQILAFLFSWILFLLARPFKGDYSFLYAWIAGSGFFLLFSLQILFQMWRGKEKTALPELLLHAANIFIYGVIFLPLLIDKKEYGFTTAGGVTLTLSLYSLILLTFSLRKKEKDEGLCLTLLLEGMGLLALTIPLLLGKNIWVFAWSLQGFLMFFAGKKLPSKALERFGCILFWIAGIKLFFMDLTHIGETRAGVLARLMERSINFLSLPAALTGAFFLQRRDENYSSSFEIRKKALLFPVIAGVLFFLYTSIECYRLMKKFQGSGAGNITLSLLWIIYGLLLLFLGVKKEIKWVRFTGLGLFITAFVKIFFFDLAGSPPLYRIGGCLLGSVCLAGGAFLYIKFQKSEETAEKKKEEEI